MAINTKAKKVLAAERKGPQANTHFPNAEPAPKFEDSGYELRNGQLPQSELLFDPDEAEGGNAHFANDGTPGSSGVVKSVKASVQAPVRKPKAVAPQFVMKTASSKRILAGEDFGVADYTQDDVGSDDPNATFTGTETGGPVDAGACADEGPQATTHFPNGEMEGSDEEANRGYLELADLTELGPDSDTSSTGLGGGDDEFEEDEEVEASFDDGSAEEIDPAGLEGDAGQNPQQSLLDITPEYEDEEVDAEFDDFGEDGGIGMAEPEGEPNEVEDEALGMETAEMASPIGSGDDMNLMDVDGMDDGAEGLETATFGTTVHAVRAGRIIASLNKKTAVKAGHGDMYMSDEFHEATVAECHTFGLRAGLRNMGFVLARVNVGRSDVLNKRVKAQAKAVTASIQRSAKASNEALGQCLAIAAVGINRQYFKDTRNELRAALEVELASAGVRGASKLVRRVFASHGVDYAKAILTLANRLVGMPEDARNQFASALDMTSDGDFDADSGIEASPEDGLGEGVDDAFGDETSSDFQMEAEFEGADEFEDEFEAEDEAPETIHAALAQGAWRPAREKVSASKAGYSVHAAAILNGSKGFGFLV